jgi:hypothetical protein
VIDGSTANFTLRADVGSWFVASNGSLINPGAPTNSLYPQIAGNVYKSFKVFEDNTRKGHDDGK